MRWRTRLCGAGSPGVIPSPDLGRPCCSRRGRFHPPSFTLRPAPMDRRKAPTNRRNSKVTAKTRFLTTSPPRQSEPRGLVHTDRGLIQTVSVTKGEGRSHGQPLSDPPRVGGVHTWVGNFLRESVHIRERKGGEREMRACLQGHLKL